MLAGLDCGAGDFLGSAAGVRAIAAENLAIDNGGAQRLLGLMIGGRHCRIQQEQEPSVTIVVQVPSEGVVGLVGAWTPRKVA